MFKSNTSGANFEWTTVYINREIELWAYFLYKYNESIQIKKETAESIIWKHGCTLL